MRLYLVKLTDVDYDTYDAAVIACESKQKLEQLLEDGEFNRERDDGFYKGDSPLVQYDYNFYIGRWQKVDEISAVGYTDLETDKEAIVILSSFNAG